MLCANCKCDKGQSYICPQCFHYDDPDFARQVLPPDSMLANRYKAAYPVAEDGFGVTYKGWDNRANRDCLIREYYLRDICARDSDNRRTVSDGSSSGMLFERGKQQFVSQMNTLKQLSVPAVDLPLAVIEENNTAYSILPFHSGRKSLLLLLNSRQTMSVKWTLDKLTPVIQALKQLHQNGVIHGGICPDSLVLEKTGQLTLTGFGCMTGAENTGVSNMIGYLLHGVLSSGFAAPEQYRGDSVGEETDVYGLCAVLYRCITGVTPENALDRLVNDTLKTPSALGFSIPPAVEAAVMDGLALRRRNRLQRVGELMKRLGIESLPPMVAEPPTETKPPKVTVPPKETEPPKNSEPPKKKEPTETTETQKKSPPPEYTIGSAIKWIAAVLLVIAIICVGLTATNLVQDKDRVSGMIATLVSVGLLLGLNVRINRFPHKRLEVFWWVVFGFFVGVYAFVVISLSTRLFNNIQSGLSSKAEMLLI